MHGTKEGALREGSLCWSQVIPPGHGFAFKLQSGQQLRIIDLEGQQVTDLLAFDCRDYKHRFSRSQTKKLNARISVSTGDILYSTTCKPMLRIVGDTVGKHDMQYSPCGPEDNLIRFNKRGDRTCIENFLEVLDPYGIKRDWLNEPFGIFFNLGVDSSGLCTTHPPLSKAGDRIDLLACMDCLIAVSACPQAFNGCNGFKLSPVGIEVLDFQRANP